MKLRKGKVYIDKKDRKLLYHTYTFIKVKEDWSITYYFIDIDKAVKYNADKLKFDKFNVEYPKNKLNELSEAPKEYKLPNLFKKKMFIK